MGLLILTFLIAACYDAQQTRDARVADLVRAGSIRVALFLPQYETDPATGAIRGNPVYMEITRLLAARIGVEVKLIGHSTPAQAMECLNARACDVAFMANEPSRAAEVDFTPPVLQLDYTYLVPGGSSIQRVVDADRPGIRIAVVRNHGSTLALSRTVKQAQQVNAELPDEAFELLRSGRADAWASVHSTLVPYSAKLLGSHVLEDAYRTNLIAISVPKGLAPRLAYVSEFIEEGKASGLVQRAIERAGELGTRVAPPRDLSAPK